MRAAKILCVFLAAFMLSSSFLFADFRDNYLKGKKAFKAGDKEKALNYFMVAYDEKPSEKLLKICNALKREIKNERSKEENPMKWVLIGADVLVSGLTVITYMDYAKQADKYDADYVKLNNTTKDNYNILLGEDKLFKEKEGLFAATAAVSIILIGYTVADAFFLHNIFPAETALGVDLSGQEIKLAVNYRY